MNCTRVLDYHWINVIKKSTNAAEGTLLYKANTKCSNWLMGKNKIFHMVILSVVLERHTVFFVWYFIHFEFLFHPMTLSDHMRMFDSVFTELFAPRRLTHDTHTKVCDHVTSNSIWNRQIPKDKQDVLWDKLSKRRDKELSETSYQLAEH